MSPQRFDLFFILIFVFIFLIFICQQSLFDINTKKINTFYIDTLEREYKEKHDLIQIPCTENEDCIRLYSKNKYELAHYDRYVCDKNNMICKINNFHEECDGKKFIYSKNVLTNNIMYQRKCLSYEPNVIDNDGNWMPGACSGGKITIRDQKIKCTCSNDKKLVFFSNFHPEVPRCVHPNFQSILYESILRPKEIKTDVHGV